MTTTCLNMIVRDEAHVIARCLRSVRPHITHWAVVDTGSSDGTQEIVRRELGGLPGELIERVWVDDFAHSRNQALELARSTGADYALFLDADEELVCEHSLANLVTQHAFYSVDMRLPSGESVKKHALARISPALRWRHALHERMTAGPGPHSWSHIADARIVNHHDASSMRDLVGKARRRAAILERMIREENAGPDRQMHMHYLGREYAKCGQLGEAIKAYTASGEMPPTSEVQFVSLYMVANCMLQRGDGLIDVMNAIDRAHRARPSRPEPFWLMAFALNQHGNHTAAERLARGVVNADTSVNDVMFPIGMYGHRWRAKLEIAVAAAAQSASRFGEAIEIYAGLLDDPKVPMKERDWIRDEIAILRRKAMGGRETAL